MIIVLGNWCVKKVYVNAFVDNKGWCGGVGLVELRGRHAAKKTASRQPYVLEVRLTYQIIHKVHYIINYNWTYIKNKGLEITFKKILQID